jgi:RHS repeat-associated protein
VVKYGYDSFDRLTTVQKYADQTATAPASFVSYTYDWAGRMIEREFGGHDPNLPCNSGSCPLNSTTRYAYQGVNLVAEFDAQGKTLASYFHLPGTIDHPLLMKRGSQIFYYHYDELGSVTQITNALGQIVKEYKYDSFGRIVLEVGDLSNPFTYTGRQWDPEAGVYLYRARAYDPETGRFLQQDPVFSVNPYPYVGDNPVNLVDPFGLTPVVYSPGGWMCTYECVAKEKPLIYAWIPYSDWGCPQSFFDRWKEVFPTCKASSECYPLGSTDKECCFSCCSRQSVKAYSAKTPDSPNPFKKVCKNDSANPSQVCEDSWAKKALDYWLYDMRLPLWYGAPLGECDPVSGSCRGNLIGATYKEGGEAWGRTETYIIVATAVVIGAIVVGETASALGYSVDTARQGNNFIRIILRKNGKFIGGLFRIDRIKEGHRIFHFWNNW